jgi:hypothetical protein
MRRFGWIALVACLWIGSAGAQQKSDVSGMTPEEASRSVTSNIKIENDKAGNPTIFSECKANVCAECSVSCPVGHSANCVAGRIDSTGRCLQAPSCFCR